MLVGLFKKGYLCRVPLLKGDCLKQLIFNFIFKKLRSP